MSDDGHAARRHRQHLRRDRRGRPPGEAGDPQGAPRKPRARIIVTGCAAQTEPASFGGMEEVDLVIGNDDKLKAQSYRALPEFGINQFEKVRVNDIFEVTETASHMVDAIEGRARAFVQVQNGCDHRCTFCIIPLWTRQFAFRADGRRRRPGQAACRKRLSRGRADRRRSDQLRPGPARQADARQAGARILREVPELDRLRLSSIDSIEADDDLMEAIATEQRLMPHFHLSLQHGDNLILKRMKRRHSREDSIAFCEDVRRLRPDAAFGADIIAGFPTETGAHFENSLKIVEECGLAHLHVFPFSPREGTPAARMPQLPREIVKAAREAPAGVAGAVSGRDRRERGFGSRGGQDGCRKGRNRAHRCRGQQSLGRASGPRSR
jgi:threonylcarbamoyladenosine tRNA methylthiotransferase MtaB